VKARTKKNGEINIVARGRAVLTALDAHWRRERAAFADDFARHLAWLHARWA